MSAVAQLSHTNLRYSSHEGLAFRVHGGIIDGLLRDESVLVCLPEQQSAAVARRLGAWAEHVTFVPATDRYAKPTAAMRLLAEFVDRSLEEGRTGVQSIGALSFTGTAADTPWLRYEAAVNEVFADVPLQAVCVVNELATPPHVLAALEELHDHDADTLAANGRRLVRTLPGAIALPERRPDVELVDPTAKEARTAVRDAIGDRVTADELDDVRLLVTELVSNAHRHTALGCTLRAWADPGQIVVRVIDSGPGIPTPGTALHTAGTDTGGRGLWIVQCIADVVDFTSGDDGHAVTAALLRR